MDHHDFPEGVDPLESHTTLRIRCATQRREIERLSRDLATCRIEAHHAERVCATMREAAPHVFAGAVAQVMAEDGHKVRRGQSHPPTPPFRPRIVPTSAPPDGNPS